MSGYGIEIDKKGAEEKMDMLFRVHDAVGETLLHFLGQTQKKAFRNATGGVVGKKTKSGALGGSLSSDLEKKTHSYRAIVGSGMKGTRQMPYARILDKGGIIRAKRKPYLVFRLPDGTWRRCKQVRIPKFRWFAMAVEANLPLLRRTMTDDEILRIAKRLA